MNNNYLIILMTYAIALFVISLITENRVLKMMLSFLLGLIPILVCIAGAVS